MIAARIAVVGLGNLMRTDDALGMLAVERLRADARLPRDVALVDGGTLGLELLYQLCGATHLLALDAVDAGAPPATLLRFAGEEIARLPVSRSVHLLGFSDLLGAMRLTGSAPSEVVVLGVSPKSFNGAPPPPPRSKPRCPGSSRPRWPSLPRGAASSTRRRGRSCQAPAPSRISPPYAESASGRFRRCSSSMETLPAMPPAPSSGNSYGDVYPAPRWACVRDLHHCTQSNGAL